MRPTCGPEYRAVVPFLQLPWQMNRFASSTFLVAHGGTPEQWANESLKFAEAAWVPAGTDLNERWPWQLWLRTGGQEPSPDYMTAVDLHLGPSWGPPEIRSSPYGPANSRSGGLGSNGHCGKDTVTAMDGFRSVSGLNRSLGSSWDLSLDECVNF
jgi:hypothetical protein